MDKKLEKILNDIEFYTKEIEQNYDKELFIVEFWTGEILHSLGELKELMKV